MYQASAATPASPDLATSKAPLSAWDEVDSGDEKDEEWEQKEIQRKAEQRQKKIREVIRTGSLLIIGLLAIGIILIYLDFVLVPLAFSKFLIYLLEPIINIVVGKRDVPFFKTRIKFPRWVGVIVVILVIAIIFTLLGIVVAFTIRDVIQHSDEHYASFQEFMGKITALAASLGYSQDQVYNLFPSINLGEYALYFLEFMIGLIPQMAMIFLIIVYMLLEVDEEEENQAKSELQMAIDTQVRAYIMLHSVVSIIAGTLAGIYLLVLGVELSLFWGLFTFVMNFIPNVGSVIATLFPTLFLIISPNFQIWKFLASGLGLTAVHFIIGQVIEPTIMGHAMEMPPITILISLLFWGSVWGILGAVLCIPLTVAIKLYLENIDHPATQMMAEMMVGNFSGFDTSRHKDFHPETPPQTRRRSQATTSQVSQ